MTPPESRIRFPNPDPGLSTGLLLGKSGQKRVRHVTFLHTDRYVFSLSAFSRALALALALFFPVSLFRTLTRARLGLRGGFEPPDLDRPGRLPQQGLCEVRLGCQDESPQLGAPGPGLERQFLPVYFRYVCLLL